MGLAFAGTAPFGAAILEGLLDPVGRPGRHVDLVISQPDRPAGRGKKLRSPAVAQLAHERDLPLIQPERSSDPEVIDELRRLGIDTVVVAAFGQMIREPMLSELLMLNVHGSLLPAYRGAAPIERSIMEGCTETGVCIMQMEAGLDTGPVASCGAVPISIGDDAGEIYRRTAEVGVQLLHIALDEAEAGTLQFTPQDQAGATYAHKITAPDRVLSLAVSARALHDRVRALSPHIGAYCSFAGERVTIWKTQLSADTDCPPGSVWHDQRRLLLGCTDGPVEVLEVQPAGKRRMPVGDWLRGLREPLPAVDQ